MPDIDRYLTAEAQHRGAEALRQSGIEGLLVTWAGHVLRAALPGVLVQHRADVLRDTAGRLAKHVDHRVDDASNRQRAAYAAWLLRLADETVADA